MWYGPSQDMLSFKRPLDTKGAIRQFRRLKVGGVLILETLIIVRNIFRFCLEYLSPNRWRSTIIRRLLDPSTECLGKILGLTTPMIS